MFFKIILPNSKSTVIGRIYHLRNQTIFLENFHENLSRVNTNNIETYSLGYFNINLQQNLRYVLQKHNLLLCKSVSNDVKNYFEFLVSKTLILRSKVKQLILRST